LFSELQHFINLVAVQGFASANTRNGDADYEDFQTQSILK